MSSDAAMKWLGEIDRKPCYWAEPGHFPQPGFYYWDGERNVHVPLEDIAHLRRKLADSAAQAAAP